VATAVRAKGGSGHGDFESETFIAIAIPIDIRNATREDARTGLGTSGTGIGNDGDPMHTIGTAQVQGVATAVRARAGSRGVDSDCPDTLIPTLAQPLRANGHDASEDGTGRTTLIPFVHAFDARQADVIQYGDLAGPLDTDSFTLGVDHPQRAAEPFTFDTTQITSVTNRSTPTPGLCHTLAKGAHAPGDAGGVMKVRRLTPRETATPSSPARRRNGSKPTCSPTTGANFPTRPRPSSGSSRRTVPAPRPWATAWRVT
jgi:hypothetical protein